MNFSPATLGRNNCWSSYNQTLYKTELKFSTHKIVSVKMADESAAISGSNVNNSRPETIVIINCVLNVPLLITSIIGNTLMLAAILRTPSLRSPSTILLCSLTVSDLLVGFVVQPLYISHEITKNASLHPVVMTTAFAACGGSLLTMTTISVDRFLALRYHMRYPNVMTTPRVTYASAAIWLISFMSSFLYFWSTNAYYSSIVVNIVICLLISTACYFRIFRIVRLHQLQIHAQQQAVASLNIAENNIQRSKKSAFNTFIFYIVTITCYTPFFIQISILAMYPQLWTNAWNFTDTLAFMNSSINPFLFCWRLRELRVAVVKTARHIFCKQTEGN